MTSITIDNKYFASVEFQNKLKIYFSIRYLFGKTFMLNLTLLTI